MGNDFDQPMKLQEREDVMTHTLRRKYPYERHRPELGNGKLV